LESAYSPPSRPVHEGTHHLPPAEVGDSARVDPRIPWQGSPWHLPAERHLLVDQPVHADEGPAAGGAHLSRVTELDEEQRTVMLALEMRTRDLERVEQTG
jgi:hypothetical protein